MSTNRKQRATIAQETLNVLEHGRYTNSQGESVSITTSLALAKEHTMHYTPDDFDEVYSIRDKHVQKRSFQTAIEVTNETTLHAAQRLICDEHEEHVLCLNFASAKNPGGGFLGGSQAQEESLARASGLYACLLQKPGYYEANRAHKSCVYTDHMIYAPDVPVFRDDQDRFLETPYLVSFLTAPAVNRGAVERNEPQVIPRISEVMSHRIENVLSLCVVHEHHVLVFGAWGCGVFQNRPEEIAQLFKYHLLENETFNHAFKRVVFAVLNNTKELSIIGAFEDVFSGKSS